MPNGAASEDAGPSNLDLLRLFEKEEEYELGITV
jgi:hypothetical protein